MAFPGMPPCIQVLLPDNDFVGELTLTNVNTGLSLNQAIYMGVEDAMFYLNNAGTYDVTINMDCGATGHRYEVGKFRTIVDGLGGYQIVSQIIPINGYMIYFTTGQPHIGVNITASLIMKFRYGAAAS